MLLSACAGGGAATVPAQLRPQPVDSALALATFDTVWTRIERTHFDTLYGGVDWSAVRDELRPRAASVRDNEELRQLLREMIGRLHESHFGLLPRELRAAATAGNAEPPGQGSDGVPGFDLRLLDGRLVVTDVADGGPAAAAGVRRGWVLLRTGSTDWNAILRALREADTELPARTERLHAWGAARNRLAGPLGSHVDLTFLNGADDTVRLTVSRGSPPGEVVSILNLPPIAAHLDHERVRAPDGTDVGVIRFNIWLPTIARQFALAMDEIRDTEGIVVDLRGNLGGVGAMVMGIAGHFMDSTASLGTMRTRTTELRFVTSPQRVNTRGQRVRPYSGPLVILVDEVSASTSEVFAAGLQALGRARIVGDTTAGLALPAQTAPLPNGDVLMHAIADLHDPTGVRVEGRGVIPNVYVALDRAALLNGRDLALERAIEVIARQRAEAGAAVPASAAPGGD
jgi:carboxyl-terminal processing protease